MLLISEFISSFKDVLKLFKSLFSILGDFSLGPATTTSWSEWQLFPTTYGKIKPSLTFSESPYWLFFLFWFLVVGIFDENILFCIFPINFCILLFLTKLIQDWRLQINQQFKCVIILPSYYYLITNKSLISLEQIVISCIFDEKFMIPKLSRHFANFKTRKS